MPGPAPLRPAGISAAVSALLVLSAALTGCQQRPPGVDFIFLNGAEPQTLDPALISGQLEGRLANALFEGLTTRDEHGRVVPGVAASWQTSPDGLRWTFLLRPDARWSNGDPVTSRDFELSWKRVLTPATASPYAEILYFIRGAEAFHNGTSTDPSSIGVYCPAPDRLEVELEAPTPFFPDLAAFVTYLPVHESARTRPVRAWMRPGRLVSNGAYTLTGWKINNRVELEKNPHYWDRERVAFQTVHALAVSKATTAFNLYSTGQADLILDKSLIPVMLIDRLRDRPDYHANPFLGTYFYRFNTRKPPFDDPRVRAAFHLTIDRNRIVQRITRAGELPTAAFTPPGIPGYEPPPGRPSDPDTARRLLAEAGYPGGTGFPRVSILYNKSELNEQIATEIKAMWKQELGVDVELRNQEWAIYLKALDNLEYDIARSSWVGDYNDPNTFLDCFVTGRGNNRTGWSNPDYDRLLRQAAQTSDPAARMALLRQAEEILVGPGLPISPIYHYVGVMFYDGTRLGGISPNVIDEHPLKSMFWKKP
jgi:oligopeptide transport system substrate-binding protein